MHTINRSYTCTCVQLHWVPYNTMHSSSTTLLLLALFIYEVSSVSWNTEAASGMNEEQFFMTAYLGTYCGAFGSWVLLLGIVAGYCKCTARERTHGLNSLGKMDFESFEQSMIVNLRAFGRFVVLCLFACHGWLAYLYFVSEEPLIAPFFGIARPLLCFLIAVFGWFSDSHPMFRWIVSDIFFIFLFLH